MSRKKIILNSLFYMYIIALLSVTLFPIPIQGLKEIGMYGGQNNNFIPFVSIFDIVGNNHLSIFIKMKQIIGNIIIFIPMGFLIPFMYDNKIYFKKILFIGILCSFFIELLQYVISILLGFHYKSCDIDDVLLNTFGCIVGFFLYKGFYISFLKKE